MIDGKFAVSDSAEKEAKDWFISLKDRFVPQSKQEWSEEDYNEIETIACHLDNIGNEAMAESLLNIMDKYKSCRPQSHWKPSDEQMRDLQHIVLQNKGNALGENLNTLLEQLKKL